MNNVIHSDFSKLEIPVVVKLFVVYEMTHKFISKFPKQERYSLGEKLGNTILDAIELFVSTNQVSKYEKERLLIKANSKVELLKILFRIVLNCSIIEARQYLEIEAKIQEIGKMTQGWIKFTRNLSK
jgi:L-cystine uptake protein TcyP (sodium:dicarboxylate symporter family)